MQINGSELNVEPENQTFNGLQSAFCIINQLVLWDKEKKKRMTNINYKHPISRSQELTKLRTVTKTLEKSLVKIFSNEEITLPTDLQS